MKSCRTLQFLVRQHFLLIGRFALKMFYKVHFTRYEACGLAIFPYAEIAGGMLYPYMENLLNFRGGRHG